MVVILLRNWLHIREIPLLLLRTNSNVSSKSLSWNVNDFSSNYPRIFGYAENSSGAKKMHSCRVNLRSGNCFPPKIYTRKNSYRNLKAFLSRNLRCIFAHSNLNWFFDASFNTPYSLPPKGYYFVTFHKFQMFFLKILSVVKLWIREGMMKM